MKLEQKAAAAGLILRKVWWSAKHWYVGLRMLISTSCFGLSHSTRSTCLVCVIRLRVIQSSGRSLKTRANIVKQPCCAAFHLHTFHFPRTAVRAQ